MPAPPASALTNSKSVPRRPANSMNPLSSLGLRGRVRPAVAFIALWVTGCAGYHLGPTNGVVAGAKTGQVNPFFNQTLEPPPTDPVNPPMRQKEQRDGPYQPDSKGRADNLGHGSPTRYSRVEGTHAA